MTAPSTGAEPSTASSRRRAAIITGAGRGIGEAIARAAASAGYFVGVLDRDADRAEQVAASIGGVSLEAAINDEEQVHLALDRFANLSGLAAPDLVVNNAGIVRFGPLATLSADDWRETVDVNLTGTFLVSRASAVRMIDAGTGGSIVNITSINGVAPGPNAGAYGATKAALVLLTQQMAIEFGPYGIRVNSVAPGLIDGGMSEPIYADQIVRAAREARVPLGRLGTVEDVARVVLFVGGPEAAYLTGENIVVDGGVVRSIIATLPRPDSVERGQPSEANGKAEGETT